MNQKLRPSPPYAPAVPRLRGVASTAAALLTTVGILAVVDELARRHGSPTAAAPSAAMPLATLTAPR